MWPPEEHERLIENMSAWMDGELPDIADTPEAGGPDDLELEVAEHQACCPSCRALFEELKELRAGFGALPEPDPPEGFAQGVMDRIRAEEKPKVIPLFKRPQVRALAGLAACLVLVVGLYGANQNKTQDDWDVTVRSFNKNAVVEEVDGAADADTPQIAAYAAPPEDTSAGTAGMEKTTPSPGTDGLTGDWDYAEVVLTLERMPEGGWELIPPETFVSPVGLTVSTELMEQLARLADEQGITASRTSGPVANDHCLIVILNETD